MRKSHVLGFLAAVLMFGGATANEIHAAARPNILLILLDDMGWSDLGCYGGEVRTPNLDALAAEGLRFTQFYNTGRCCPTRASLMTGLYPHQAGVGRMTFDLGLPGYRGQLQPNTVTIAEVLRAAGYHTAMVGKWHLSLTRESTGHLRHLNNQRIRDTFADPATYPVGRGFERHYGVIWGVINYFDPFSLVRNTEPVRQVPTGYYATEAFTDQAVEWIDELAQQEQPFFLYLAHCAPHWPLHALPGDIEHYREAYKVGWQAIREARYRRQVALGLLDPAAAPLSERFAAKTDWDENPDQEWDARAMACHAAMIDRVDQGIGRIIRALKERNQYDDTLILVLSDNGASREEPSEPGFDRVSETRDGRPIRYFGRNRPKDAPPGSETTYASLGPHWANAANTPFRLFKATQYEGGIRTPLIVHWPQGLKVKPGSVTKQPGHVIDILATCLDVAEATYPTTFHGQDITPLEGRSLTPIFRGEQRTGHEALFFEHFGARAVRQGNWKLVAPSGGAWELYDFAQDQTETRNVAAPHPDVVHRLAALWDGWAKRAQVLPRPEDTPKPSNK